MKFIIASVLAATALLTPASAQTSKELFDSMSHGLRYCDEGSQVLIKSYSSLLVELSPKDKDELVFVLERSRGYEEFAEIYKRAMIVVLSIRRSDQETLRPDDFTYHPIAKRKDGTWCDDDAWLNGWVFLNKRIAESLGKKYRD